MKWATPCAAIIAAALLLGGCSTLQRPEEVTWQALHAVDFLQTMEIPGSECLREGHPVTRNLIGRQPSTHGVIAWGIASAGVHLLVSDILLERDMPRAYAAWQFLTIGDTGFAVGKNHGVGIRIGRRNKTWCSK